MTCRNIVCVVHVYMCMCVYKNLLLPITPNHMWNHTVYTVLQLDETPLRVRQ